MKGGEEMFKVLQYRYKPTKNERRLLRLLCHISKNLYNSAIYTLRQEYFKTKKIISYYELNRILKENENYHILNTYTSICIIRNAHTTFNNFIKGYTKLPKYLKPNDYYLLYTEQIRRVYKDKSLSIKLPLSNLTRTSRTFNKMFEDELINKFIKESEIKESFDIYFKVPKVIESKQIRQLSIIPLNKGLEYKIGFTYIDDFMSQIQEDKDLIMAIDLGINNLATCVISNNESFIIDGKYIKSINQFYNKRKAYLQSKKKSQKEYTKMEYKVTDKRNRRIADAINKAAKQIIDYSLTNKVTEIIVGYNKGFKTKGIKDITYKKLKSKVNQNFIQVPLYKFKERIKYLCKINNIIYTEINESYTSICSFYDDEEIKYHSNYLGKRITRSLYKTNDNRIINADINGALNILKKSKPNRIDIISFLRNKGQTIPIRQKIKLN